MNSQQRSGPRRGAPGHRTATLAVSWHFCLLGQCEACSGWSGTAEGGGSPSTGAAGPPALAPPQSLMNLNQGQESPKGVFRLGEKSICGKQTHMWTTGAKPGVSAPMPPLGPSSGRVSPCPCLQFPGQGPVLGADLTKEGWEELGADDLFVLREGPTSLGGTSRLLWGRGHHLPLRSVWVGCMTQSDPSVVGGPETGLGAL